MSFPGGSTEVTREIICSLEHQVPLVLGTCNTIDINELTFKYRNDAGVSDPRRVRMMHLNSG